MRRLRLAGCCAVALLAPFLGGSTERWSEGIILMLLAALVLLFPPKGFVSPAFAGAVLFLLAMVVPSFLPASWFAMPGWRQQLEGAGIPTGGLLSPQPWISGECAVLLLAGVLWITWLAAQEWEPGERRWLMAVFAGGAALLAGLALAAFYGGHPVPFWHSERGFGPFPNRNQTGDFFAVGGIMAAACACESLRGKKRTALFYIPAAALLAAALVSSYSRAAVILFFAGSAAWVALLGLVSRSAKYPGLAAALLITLAALFLLFGGPTLERFRGDGVTFGFRRLIARDVFSMIHASPWCGIGMGNFEPVFAGFRKESAMPSRILHPESDWLWLWAEMGLPAVLAVLAGAAILLKRVAPLERGTDRRLRLGAAAAALVFAVHGIVDVSGHRLGSALPGLFMLGLALNRPATARGGSRFAPLCFRAAAAVTGAVGAAWLWAVLQSYPLPGATGAVLLKQRGQRQLAAGLCQTAASSASGALRWAPLDWQLYFQRASALVCKGDRQDALGDFHRAELLETTSPLVTFEEGRIWMYSRPALAVAPFRETLRRCPPSETEQYFAQMMDFAVAAPEVQLSFYPLAEGNPGLVIVYLAHSSPAEMKRRIDAILGSDPGLRAFDAGQKTAFFRIWLGVGGGDALMKRLDTTPEWQPLAWRQAADYLASHGDYGAACGWVFRFAPPPALPARMEGSMPDLRRRLALRPGDFAAGYALYATLADQKDDAQALVVVRGLTAQPGCPAYFYFLQAGAESRMGDFSAAWNSLQKYREFPGN